jgi:hypothetical protein
VTLDEGCSGTQALGNTFKTLAFFWQKSVLGERNFCWPEEQFEILESDVGFRV